MHESSASVRPSKLVKPALFLIIVTLLFATGLYTEHGTWPIEDNPRYACYFFVALVAAGLNVRGRGGPSSMSFVFVIIALVELNLKETVLIAGSAIVIQSVGRKMTQDRAASTLSCLLSTFAAALVSQWVYRSGLLRALDLEPPVRLVLAVIASFAAYHVPAALAGLPGSGFQFKRLVESLYLWSFPYHLIAAMVTALYSFIYPFVNWYSPALLLPLVYLIYWSFEAYTRRLDKQRSNAVVVSKLHLRTIETLALAIEAKDHTTHEHLKRVQIYACELGSDLGLDDTQLEALRAAAVLHDIGKLAVPEHILSKPGRLTPEEFEKMKIHPLVGAEILEQVRFPYPVAPIVRAHHEKWDGTGYPDGLAGESIPIGARILTTVDCLDALASDRQYRRALPLDAAMQQIAAKAGKDFDPRVIRALERRYRDLEQLARHAAPIKPLFESLPTDTNQAGPDLVAPASSSADTTALPPPPFLQTIGAAREEVQKLFELTQELGSSLELRDTCLVLARGLQPLVPYDALALFLEKGKRLVPQFLNGPDSGMLTSLSLPKAGGVSGWVATNAKPAVNCDPLRDGPALRMFGCMLSVPLIGRRGVLGALSLYNRKRASYGAEHLRLVSAIAPKLSLAVENGLNFQTAESKASTDYLTGLPNAQSLFVHMERELELSRYLASSLAVLVCDLDGFKHLNDTLGHLTGNRLLQAAARALESRCREYDYVARMGGDEFVIVCSGLGREEAVRRIPEFQDAIRAAGQDLCGPGLLGASLGAAVFPKDGEAPDELLAAADREMYKAKQPSKSPARFTTIRENAVSLVP